MIQIVGKPEVQTEAGGTGMEAELKIRRDLLHMEKTDQQIYEEFASQLCRWGEDGTVPGMGNQDISYGLSQQRKRLEKYHAKIEYRLKQRVGRPEQATSAVFSDVSYTNKLVWKPFRKEVDYYREGRKCLSIKDDEQLYMVITWLKDTKEKIVYCCPNCGAISQVDALLEGCPYCHTKFFMSDLFPKVTNFYFLRDYAMSEQESNGKMAKWMITGALAGLLIRLPDVLMALIHGDSLFFLALTTIFTMGVAAVFGYFALSIRLLARVMKDAVKQAPRVAGQLQVKKKLTDIMKPFDPGFTFEYFFCKVQALLKIYIFTDDRSNLAIYEGAPEACGFDNIIDAQFEGAISLNGSRIEGNYCYLDLNVYMTDVYCQGDRLRRRSDTFRVGLCRNISRPVDYGFSIRQVSCKSCGASFDATRERFCPYCKSRYELREDDWVITYIRKR